MPYDETLAERVRARFASRTDVAEKTMFGGLTFMVRGHMCCGVAGDELMVRVGPEGWADALALPGAREMDFTGRSLKGFLFVGAPAIETDAGLGEWVERATRFAESLPAG